MADGQLFWIMPPPSAADFVGTAVTVTSVCSGT